MCALDSAAVRALAARLQHEDNGDLLDPGDRGVRHGPGIRKSLIRI